MGNEIRKDPWQTDICLGHWFYDVRASYKGPRQVTDLLVDIVSKNGNLLLNIPQSPDGTIDDECRYTLEKTAVMHADHTLKTFIRPDGSVCHGYQFMEAGGVAAGEVNHCGYGVSSFWVRGLT